MAEVIRVLKVRTSAVTASFRYPHVMVGKLPTFEMPPPATIYGHLCGVLGEWFDPRGLAFAYTFTYKQLAEDIELGHIVEYASGRNEKSLGGLPKNVEGSMNPQRRQFLFHPEMTLYLSGPTELLERLQKHFLSPVFALVLGRSQDLATCHTAEFVELTRSDRAFYSHTLLPWSLRPSVFSGRPVYMPKWIDYRRMREARFERYLEIGNRPLRIFGEGQEEDILDRTPFAKIWADDSEMKNFLSRTLPRGIWFHPLGDDEAC
ncbi:CRISPR-associated protein Cas5 [Heliobacterium gestii]|uniref:CRISPR-associated protein Cas5 n=1 Tax=Heliomicrobium gestii TaxID=2699 RepID=A0A845LAU8_HELGE|nr:CRISPR-associated protein Cas5 [Heliomicrobium gestii]MBM7865385.1 CRISPR-associated protein Cas5t [Heliomicrobium gestii]MZP41645.1 CRISPR-associated protein Cas5 [Heliomicrobium gestii]